MYVRVFVCVLQRGGKIQGLGVESGVDDFTGGDYLNKWGKQMGIVPMLRPHGAL